MEQENKIENEVINEQKNDNEQKNVINENPDPEKKGFSIAAMVLGIVSVCLANSMLIGVSCGVLGIVFGLKGKKQGGVKMAKAGYILGIIGCSIQALLFLVGLCVGFAGISYFF